MPVVVLCCALALPVAMTARPAVAAPASLQATPTPTATPPAPVALDWSQTTPQVATQISGAASWLTPTDPLGLVLLGILVLQLSAVLIGGAVGLVEQRRER